MRWPALNECVTDDRRTRVTDAMASGWAVPISNVS
jgi:hypothetical protein